MLIRTDVINFYLSKKIKPISYLEIGVQDPDANFNHINANLKDGVDPFPLLPCKFIMTSDEFFEQNKTKYDIIFVDGDHTFEQVYKDVINSINILKKDGIIIIHDCNPKTEWYQRKRDDIHKLDGPWSGTVWKAFVKLRTENENIEMFTIDVDCGIGIVIPGRKQKLFSCKENIYEYEVFSKYRKEALNLISENEWLIKCTRNNFVPTVDKGFVKYKCDTLPGLKSRSF